MTDQKSSHAGVAAGAHARPLLIACPLRPSGVCIDHAPARIQPSAPASVLAAPCWRCSTKTRGLRVDAAHVDVALRSPSKTTPSASCSGRGAPSRRGRRAGVNARTTGNLLTQGSQAPGQTALRRNTRMQFRKLGCLAHLRSMRVAFRSCSYPRSTKVLITAFGPFGLTWPREPCNG